MDDSTLAAEAEALLEALSHGETPSGPLFERLYEDLRRIASAHRARWVGDHTLNTTALVHEAYLKLADANVAGRAHVLAVASRAMRQVLFSYSASQKAQKRGGSAPVLELDEQYMGASPLTELQADRTAVLEEALARLEAANPRAARIVECRFFGGMTIDETAEALRLASATVGRSWRTARSWLYGELRDDVTGAWQALESESS